MKKSYRDELRAKDIDHLMVQVNTLKQKIAQLKFNARAGKTATIKESNNIKQEIATILTLIHEKRNHE
ncbi:MAG: 50S ribosomal protein L29 [Candidatus Paceibacterota bacterium]